MRLKLVAFFCILSTSAQTIENEEIKKAVAGFFFTMPKTLLSGKNETVCLSTHYSSTPIKILVDLKIREKHFYSTWNTSSDHSCFELNVPSHNMKEPHFATVKVQVQLNGFIYSAHSQDPVVIFPNKNVIFIETDRSTYKSEDKIKIRILMLSHDLRPVKDCKIKIVRIKNPLGVGVVVWENVTTELGLVQLEHQLSRDAVEGKWRIEADGESKIFEVNKYVLPRFKVQILYPKIIYHKAPSVTMKVCATYTHGGGVKGSAFIRLSDSLNNMKTIQVLKRMSNGCADFSFTNNELSLSNIRKKFPLMDPKVNIHITATVTEYGTDKMEITTAKSFITLKAYNMKFAAKNLLLPGLPYQGKIHLSNINTDLKGEVLEVCYNIAIKKSWNYLNREQCSNFTLGNEKSVPFYIPPFKNNVIHLQLNARSLNHTNIGDSLLVVRLYSPSSSYITLEQMHPSDSSKCGTLQQFTVQYTIDRMKDHENLTFYYMIKSRGQILKLRSITQNVQKYHINYFSEYKDIVGTSHKHTKSGSTMGKFSLNFKLEEKIISSYNLLVYYITEAGEIISALKEIEIEPCVNNKVEANWSHKQIAPGGTASLLIQTKSDCLCSISATDKAVKFMDNHKLLDVKSFLTPFLQEQEIPESGRKSCVPPVKKNREVAALTESETMWDLKRKKRYVYSFSEDYDAYDIFNKFGTTTITNFKIITKPCYTGPMPPTNNPVQFLTNQYDTQNDEAVTPIRSFFPETWLWELVPVRGASVIHRNVPHTITAWETNVLCVSHIEGVGFSKTVDISTYQPFFVDVLTPYSIKKGEILYLNVIVFNYLNYNIPIRIDLRTSDGLKMLHFSNQKSISYCISNNDTVTNIFELKATETGNMNITVIAELDAAYPGQCGPEVMVNKRDVVTKILLVEPDGYPFKLTKSALMCGSDANTQSNITWDLTIPENIVPNTAKTTITLNGDILGQTIENLENLIVMPTGCGEQIMATMAPNLYVFRYLNATKSLTPSLRHRIVRNLKIGYQRILNYIHKDGSFSAFGYHDSSGSMFLTAFVVRTLQDMKQYIYVDQRIIDRAVSWILNHQLENGCFNTMLHVFQDMGETNIENSTAALTSYVIISLLDGNIEIPESVTTNAKYCIRGHYYFDKYTLAVSSYALLKVNWHSEAQRILKRLFQISSQKDNMMWWINRDNDSSTANDIEITSYVLLSLLHQKTEENLAKAHSIVRWLSTKQGPQGGFKSTQDTVVALDALARYSTFVSHKHIDMDVTLETPEQVYQVKIKTENRLKSKKTTLKPTDNSVKIGVQGEGCVLVQALMSYYLKQVSSNDAFKLDMEISPVSNIDECSIATLTPCFKYNGPDLQANMAILEVDLPSGYQADRASLYKLLAENITTKVKMFEEEEQKIVLYFTKIDAQQICINFNINENEIVQSRSESTVKLYDYYKPEYQVLQFYTLNDKCKFHNLTIPSISGNFSYVSNETEKNVVKRNTKLNPYFVDLDIELAEPGGLEGNTPIYIKPNKNISLNSNSSVHPDATNSTSKCLDISKQG